MPNSEPVVRKNIERKKYPRVVGVLKESAGATMITKRILDLGVNLTVGELLASAPIDNLNMSDTLTLDDAVRGLRTKETELNDSGVIKEENAHFAGRGGFRGGRGG